MLFEDTECVDVSFQELVQCWLRVRRFFHIFCSHILTRGQGSDRKELLRFVQEQHLDDFSLSGLENVPSKCFPGPVKQITRAISKTTRSYRGNFRRLTDVVRTKIVFQKFSDIQVFLQLLHQRALCSSSADIRHLLRRGVSDQADSSQIMQIMRVRNRFDPSIRRQQLFGGYRDCALKIKMGFTCVQSHSPADYVKFVPLSQWRNSNVKRLVFEVQLHLAGMQLDDGTDGDAAHHEVYVQSRNLLSI
jgi:hypothetical protein